ncbi:heme oxygenase [bacterium A37T11]|nr:heme oxygenase [bacterium A37T11]
MLSTKIKEATREAHQQLEKTVVLKLKSIRSAEDYAGFLKYFYAYFNAVESVIAPYISETLLPDQADRRNSSYLRNDIEALGSSVDQLPVVYTPMINSPLEALSALYVLEGSIMGGPYIVQMLQKYGMTTGFSFFSGYGENTGRMWGAFTAALSAQAGNAEEEAQAIRTANETFARFGDVFEQDFQTVAG